MLPTVVPLLVSIFVFFSARAFYIRNEVKFSSKIPKKLLKFSLSDKISGNLRAICGLQRHLWPPLDGRFDRNSLRLSGKYPQMSNYVRETDRRLLFAGEQSNSAENVQFGRGGAAEMSTKSVGSDEKTRLSLGQVEKWRNDCALCV